MSDQTKTLTKATETASTENSKTQNTGGKSHPEEKNNIYIVYNTMKFKATQPEPTQAQKVNFINCDLDDFFTEEKTQTKQTEFLCGVCKEDAIFKYKNDNILYGYCDECYKNHKKDLYDQFKYDRMTENYNYIKPYLNDRIKKIKNEYRQEYINMLIINDERDKLQKFLNEEKIKQDVEKEIDETFEEIKKEIKKPLKMDLTQDKKIYKFYLPEKYINDSDKIKKSFIEFIDDDLFLQIMDDDKLKKLIEDKNIRNYALYSDDIRTKLILYCNYLFYFMSDYDIEKFLRKNCKYNKHELLYKFKDYIDELDYTKALKMFNFSKLLKLINDKLFNITTEFMEERIEEEEDEETRQRENTQEDDREKANDRKFRNHLEDSEKHFYCEIKESLNRLYYYQEKYYNYVNEYKEANPKHQKNIKRIKEEYLKGFKLDVFIIKPVYNLIYLLYKSYNLFLLQPKYKITSDNDFKFYILNKETKEEITALIFEDMEDQEILLNQYLKDNIYLFSHSFLKPLFLEDYKNNYIYVNSEGDIIEDMSDEQINNLFNGDYKNNDEIYNNIHLESVLDRAINADGLNHILFCSEAEEINYKSTTILIKFDN